MNNGMLKCKGKEILRKKNNKILRLGYIGVGCSNWNDKYGSVLDLPHVNFTVVFSDVESIN